MSVHNSFTEEPTENAQEEDFLFADDDSLFAEDDEDSGESGEQEGTSLAQRVRVRPWKILVVDDEPEIHAMTAMVLADMRYKGRGIQMLSAHSARQARELLASEHDIACILLDVVMETDDAGLQLVHHIRQEMGNRHVRIILRTGQPGQAPERDVIIDYDINDYKAKTELTSQKLFTTMIATLRSYDDIMALEMSRLGLQRVIDASANLFQVRSMRSFASGVLTQLSALLETPVSGILCTQKGSDSREKSCGEGLFVLAGAGEFEPCAQGVSCHPEDDEQQFESEEASLQLVCGKSCSIHQVIHRALSEKKSFYQDDALALYIRTPNHRQVVAYLRVGRPLESWEEQLVQVFCGKVSVGFDNLWLYEQIKRAHEATVVALADLAEYKDTDTGEHVLRVERMTQKVALKLRDLGHFTDSLDDLFIEQVSTAAILHDVGKVSTPDHILQKPGRLTSDEFAIMKQHAQVGGAILEKAGRLAEGSSYLSLGAEIAFGHHERWDGLGYPRGLQGEEIPLSARIVAVVDVYDALVSVRPYKTPWPVDQALDYIRDGSGQQFDPRVVEAFLAMIGED